MVRLCAFALMLISFAHTAVPTAAEDVQVWLSNEQLGASDHDPDTLLCRDKKLWAYQARQLMPWDAAPDDLYRWKNQHADVYVDMNEHNMLEWMSGLPLETYHNLFEFLRIRILYARYQARYANLRQSLGLETNQRVVPVHQHQAINHLYGPGAPYLHEPHNAQIASIETFESTYIAFMQLLKLVLASVMFWSNFLCLYRCHRSVSAHVRPTQCIYALAR